MKTFKNSTKIDHLLSFRNFSRNQTDVVRPSSSHQTEKKSPSSQPVSHITRYIHGGAAMAMAWQLSFLVSTLLSDHTDWSPLRLVVCAP